METKKYNKKIYINGEYCEYYGWTIVSMVKDNLKWIENYIKKNNIINKYISALPYESYHMTISGIWSNGIKFLKSQRENLKIYMKEEDINKLEKETYKEKKYNPYNCIDNLLYRLYFECSRYNLEEVEIKIKNVYCNLHTVGLSFEIINEHENICKLREKIINICENNDGMDTFHITIGYLYREINNEILKNILDEFNILNQLLNGIIIKLNKPDVYLFKSMKEYIPFKNIY